MNAIERFPSNLRTAMSDAGVSATELASKIGCTDSAVNGWLSGRVFPLTKNLVKIEDELHVSVDDLFGIPSVEKVDPIDKPLFSVGDKVFDMGNHDAGLQVITEVAYRLRENKQPFYTYTIRAENGTLSAHLGSDLIAEKDMAEPDPEYVAEVVIHGDKVQARIYEQDSDNQTLIAYGNARNFIGGRVGIAQAISYAAMRAYKALEAKEEN